MFGSGTAYSLILFEPVLVPHTIVILLTVTVAAVNENDPSAPITAGLAINLSQSHQSLSVSNKKSRSEQGTSKHVFADKFPHYPPSIFLFPDMKHTIIRA